MRSAAEAAPCITSRDATVVKKEAFNQRSGLGGRQLLPIRYAPFWSRPRGKGGTVP